MTRVINTILAPFNTQKTAQYAPLSLCLVLLVLASCDPVEEIMQALEESEVAELAEGALNGQVGGMSENLGALSEQLTMAVENGELCDSLYSLTIEENLSAGLIGASYSMQLSYLLSCGMFNIPQSATVSTATAITYSSPRLSSNDSAAFSVTASGLQPTATAIAFAGSYTRSGTQLLTSTQREIDIDITSELTLTLTDVTVSKSTGEVTGGTATLSLSGSTPEGTFSYTGDLVFNGDGTATLTINNTAYTLTLN